MKKSKRGRKEGETGRVKKEKGKGEKENTERDPKYKLERDLDYFTLSTSSFP